LHGLPAASATAQDCLSAALDVGAVSMVADRATVEDLRAFAPTVLIASPRDALRLGRQGDLADGSVRLVVVSGQPGGSISSTRRRVEHGLGARCLDVYASTESGVVGWGCTAAGGLHLTEDEFVVECLDPKSGSPIPDGSVGELVLTTRDEQRTPLVRYRTGDLVQLSHVPCGCGNPNVRAESGVLGRIAERLLVRGVELLPSTVEQVVLRHPAVADYGIVEYRVRGECEVGVQIEADDAIATEGDRARVAAEVSQDLRRSFGLRLQCDVVPPGTIVSQADGRRARTLRRQ
jgi:phenylacetate-CoA ligase